MKQFEKIEKLIHRMKSLGKAIDKKRKQDTTIGQMTEQQHWDEYYGEINREFNAEIMEELMEIGY